MPGKKFFIMVLLLLLLNTLIGSHVFGAHLRENPLEGARRSAFPICDVKQESVEGSAGNTRASDVDYTISVDFEPGSLVLEPGEDAEVEMHIESSNVRKTTVRLLAVGNLSGLVKIPPEAVVHPDDGVVVVLNISNTTILRPWNYEVRIEVSHEDNREFHSLPLMITSGGNGNGGEENGDAGKKEENGPLTGSLLPLVLICVLAIALILLLILVLRRPRRAARDTVPKANATKEGSGERDTGGQGSTRKRKGPGPGGKKHGSRKGGGVEKAAGTPRRSQAAAARRTVEPFTATPAKGDPMTGMAGSSAPADAVKGDTPSEDGFSSVSRPSDPVPKGPQIVGISGLFAISDMFLVYVDGRLVRSVSVKSHLRESMDQDVMSGMLTAITDFIRHSFKEDSGALKSLQYGKMTIFLERGVGMYLAVVFQGNPPEEFRQNMRWLLIRLWKRYKYKLKVWDGSQDGLDDLDEMLLTIMEVTEPEEEAPAAPVPPPKVSSEAVPVRSKADEAVMCGICFGVVKPGLVIINCPCGAKYHGTCGDRVEVCPKCGISLSGPAPEGGPEGTDAPVELNIPPTEVEPGPEKADFPPTSPYSGTQPPGESLEFIFDLAADPPSYVIPLTDTPADPPSHVIPLTDTPADPPSYVIPFTDTPADPPSHVIPFTDTPADPPSHVIPFTDTSADPPSYVIPLTDTPADPPSYVIPLTDTPAALPERSETSPVKIQKEDTGQNEGRSAKKDESMGKEDDPKTSGEALPGGQPKRVEFRIEL